ncbi:MAG: hypothetical protein O2960_03720 [Verrucomicrobia bacterium]|nr:hypothetical protein [Verrucomicrobiota bacterium]
MRTACQYVHLNPVRARLIGADQGLKSYRSSSFAAYLQPARKRAVWLRVDRVLGESGIGRDTKAGREYFEGLMEQRRHSAKEKIYRSIWRGWCWGDKKFRKELLGQLSEQMGANHYGEERREIEDEKAEAILAEELRTLSRTPLDSTRRGI